MEDDDPKDVLTIEEIAKRLRCSKTHVCNLLRGEVEGVPRLTHVAMGRRKVVRHEWLTDWMEANKSRC
jgi:excisionase family DNA binding protein